MKMSLFSENLEFLEPASFLVGVLRAIRNSEDSFGFGKVIGRRWVVSNDGTYYNIPLVHIFPQDLREVVLHQVLELLEANPHSKRSSRGTLDLNWQTTTQAANKAEVNGQKNTDQLDQVCHKIMMKRKIYSFHPDLRYTWLI